MTAYTGGDVESLLAALPASSGRLVVISSGDVYWAYGAFLGLTPPRPVAAPMDERVPLRDRLYPYRDRAGGPDDPLYRYEKIDVERRAASAAVPVTILRLPMVYGPGDPQGRVSGYLKRLDTRRLRALLGYREPVGRSEGLRRTAPWRGSAADRISP